MSQELQPIDKIKHVKDAGGKVLPVLGTGIIDIVTCVKCKEEGRQMYFPTGSFVLFSTKIMQKRFSCVKREIAIVKSLSTSLSVDIGGYKMSRFRVFTTCLLGVVNRGYSFVLFRRIQKIIQDLSRAHHSQ